MNKFTEVLLSAYMENGIWYGVYSLWPNNEKEWDGNGFKRIIKPINQE